MTLDGWSAFALCGCLALAFAVRRNWNGRTITIARILTRRLFSGRRRVHYSRLREEARAPSAKDDVAAAARDKEEEHDSDEEEELPP